MPCIPAGSTPGPQLHGLRGRAAAPAAAAASPLAAAPPALARPLPLAVPAQARARPHAAQLHQLPQLQR